MDAESGAPKDELAADTLSWFKTLGVDYKKLSQVIAAGPCPKVNLYINNISNIDLDDSGLSTTNVCQFYLFFFVKNKKLLSIQVFAAINDGIARANKLATSNAQRIQKFAILPADFSIPTGELGPTLKVKRNVVTKKYADIIEKFYV